MDSNSVIKVYCSIMLVIGGFIYVINVSVIFRGKW